jgi:hypothetical protein
MKKQAHVRHFNKHLQVAASPLNPVKFQLGICLLVAILLVFVLSISHVSLSLQFGVLISYSLAAAVFIVWRVRRVIHAASQKQ